jgi:hypothetical protein
MPAGFGIPPISLGGLPYYAGDWSESRFVGAENREAWAGQPKRELTERLHAIKEKARQAEWREVPVECHATSEDLEELLDCARKIKYAFNGALDRPNVSGETRSFVGLALKAGLIHPDSYLAMQLHLRWDVEWLRMLPDEPNGLKDVLATLPLLLPQETAPIQMVLTGPVITDKIWLESMIPKVRDLQRLQEAMGDRQPSTPQISPADARSMRLTPPMSIGTLASFYGGEMNQRKLSRLMKADRLRGTKINREAYQWDPETLPPQVVQKIKQAYPSWGV